MSDRRVRGGVFPCDLRAVEEAPQRGDRKMMPVPGQPSANFSRREIVLLGDQGMNTPRLRLDPL